VTFSARARIRRSAVRHNLQLIKSKVPGARVMAAIKGNAYGHGLIPVAQALEDADCLAVARLAEARVLRHAGISSPIALLGGILSADDLNEVLSLDIQVGVHDAQQIRWLEKHAGAPPVAWLKIDTGMNRLGIRPGDAADAIARLRTCTRELGLMTHFSCADDPANPTTRRQLSRFMPLAEHFDGAVSVANSASLLGTEETLDELADIRKQGRLWIRPGLALYGISPFSGTVGADYGLRPVMQFEATLISVKVLPAGDRVGYGGTWRTERDTMLGIVAAGYGDGYSRYIPTGTPVLVNGRRVPVVGRVSMDVTAVDLGLDSADKVGDGVILWGDELPVEEIAEFAGTIPYQLVTGVTHREESIVED
jgi:alanine racemase